MITRNQPVSRVEGTAVITEVGGEVKVDNYFRFYKPREQLIRPKKRWSFWRRFV